MTITILTEEQARDIAEKAVQRAIEIMFNKFSLEKKAEISEVMTINEAAEYLRCSTSHLRNKIRKKEIPVYNRLGHPRLYKSDIDKWLKEE